MSADRSANERFALTAQIAHIERQEDEFAELRNSHQRSLERFHDGFRTVARRREGSLHDCMPSGSRSAQADLESNLDLLARVERHVDDSFAELEQTSAQVRWALDEERERLIKERNALPWE